MLCCRELFRKYYDELPHKPALKFAEPGIERQDSVRNGFEVGLPHYEIWKYCQSTSRVQA